jgi:hypothetical protein
MGPDSGPLSGKVRPLAILTSETNMQLNACDTEKRTAIRTDLGAIFASLELSRSTWRITSLAPGADEKMSKYAVRGGDIAGLLARFVEIKDKYLDRPGSGQSQQIRVGDRPGTWPNQPGVRLVLPT